MKFRRAIYLRRNDGGTARISGGIEICRVAAYLNHQLQAVARRPG
jgi:hypothetical protein